MRYLDEAVSQLFLEAVQPAQLETMLAALDELERERQTLDRQWQLRLDQARYQVHLAQRQYDAVDPENRLVAGALEGRWNDALLYLNQVEQDYAQSQCHPLASLSEAEQHAVRQLAHDLPELWQADTTTATDRKRLLRLVVRDITLTTEPESRSADFVIWWSGEATTRHRVTCPPIGWHCVTDEQVLRRIRQLAPIHPDHRIADLLNADGFVTQTGKTWTYQRVFSIRKQHDIPTGCPIDTGQDIPRGDGLVSVKTAANMLNVSASTIHLWAKQGVLQYDQRVQLSKRWIKVDDEE